ncbi:MAG TPA: hypothetical protein VK939_03560, partial [Longimicrobiales bacterium]|nr:hypothetical protein [Longimicrobiales bacterium]
MTYRGIFGGAAALLLAAAAPAPLAAQTAAPAAPERAVRRDIPLTNMIRRAFAAGTRDSTGRPGANYWQTRVDYEIATRLEPETGVVSGRERVVLHNNGGVPMQMIVLRLDQNIFAPHAMRATPIGDVTGGLRITQLNVDGQAVDLAPRAPGRAAEGAAV